MFIAKSLVLGNIVFVRYFDEVDDSARTKLIFAEKYLKKKMQRKSHCRESGGCKETCIVKNHLFFFTH